MAPPPAAEGRRAGRRAGRASAPARARRRPRAQGVGAGAGARVGGAAATREGAGSPGGRIADTATGFWPAARSTLGIPGTAARASPGDVNSPQYRPMQGRPSTDRRSTKISGGFPEARTWRSRLETSQKMASCTVNRERPLSRRDPWKASAAPRESPAASSSRPVAAGAGWSCASTFAASRTRRPEVTSPLISLASLSCASRFVTIVRDLPRPVHEGRSRRPPSMRPSHREAVRPGPTGSGSPGRRARRPARSPARPRACIW